MGCRARGGDEPAATGVNPNLRPLTIYVETLPDANPHLPLKRCRMLPPLRTDTAAKARFPADNKARHHTTPPCAMHGPPAGKRCRWRARHMGETLPSACKRLCRTPLHSCLGALCHAPTSARFKVALLHDRTCPPLAAFVSSLSALACRSAQNMDTTLGPIGAAIERIAELLGCSPDKVFDM